MQTAFLVSLLSLVPVAPVVVDSARDTVVVCPQPFLDTLQPWLVHRSRQGHHCAYVSNVYSPSEIRRRIRQVAGEGKLGFVLIVGDSEASEGHRESPPRTVPAHYAAAKVTPRWGSEPEILTDNWYADLDDDEKPDVAIGRLTADNRQDLGVMIRKIIDYERTANTGPWRRRINLIAGVGGFGRIADSVIEATVKRFVAEGIPTAYRTTMTYASWRSPYCPDPRQFRLTALRRLNEGCLVWVYVGHGQHDRLDDLRVPGASLPIMNCRDTAYMRSDDGLPIAVFLSCYAGAFDRPTDCLAEEMLRTEGAPVAAISGSRVTMPYANAVLCDELLTEFFGGQCETLGEVVLHAKRRMFDEESPSKNRRMLDAIAKLASPSPEDLAAERREHAMLFNLIGDPLLRIRPPGHVELELPERTDAGTMLNVVGRCDVEGMCTVELVCRRDRMTFTPPPRREFDPAPEALSALNDVYARANDGRWAAKSTPIQGGRFETQIEVPQDAHGPCHVRVFVQGDSQFAIGARDVYVKRRSSADTEEDSSRKP